MYQVGVGWIPQSDQKGLQFCFINYVRCHQIAMNSHTQQLKYLQQLSNNILGIY